MDINWRPLLHAYASYRWLAALLNRCWLFVTRRNPCSSASNVRAVGSYSLPLLTQTSRFDLCFDSSIFDAFRCCVYWPCSVLIGDPRCSSTWNARLLPNTSYYCLGLATIHKHDWEFSHSIITRLALCVHVPLSIFHLLSLPWILVQREQPSTELLPAKKNIGTLNVPKVQEHCTSDTLQDLVLREVG